MARARHRRLDEHAGRLRRRGLFRELGRHLARGLGGRRYGDLDPPAHQHRDRRLPAPPRQSRLRRRRRGQPPRGRQRHRNTGVVARSRSAPQHAHLLVADRGRRHDRRRCRVGRAGDPEARLHVPRQHRRARRGHRRRTVARLHHGEQRPTGRGRLGLVVRGGRQRPRPALHRHRADVRATGVTAWRRAHGDRVRDRRSSVDSSVHRRRRVHDLRPSAAGSRRRPRRGAELVPHRQPGRRRGRRQGGCLRGLRPRRRKRRVGPSTFPPAATSAGS